MKKDDYKENDDNGDDNENDDDNEERWRLIGQTWVWQGMHAFIIS